MTYVIVCHLTIPPPTQPTKYGIVGGADSVSAVLRKSSGLLYGMASTNGIAKLHVIVVRKAVHSGEDIPQRLLCLGNWCYDDPLPLLLNEGVPSATSMLLGR